MASRPSRPLIISAVYVSIPHLSHHSSERPVDGEEAAPPARVKGLVDGEHHEAAGRAAQHSGKDGGGDGVGVAVRGDGELRAAVEGHEAEEEDEAPERGERHRVAGHLVGFAIGVESTGQEL